MLQEEGELFEQARKGMPPTLPGRAIAILHVESVYSGAERLDG